MHLVAADWIVIFAYFALNLGIGFYYMRRAGGNVSEYFLSGRSVSWWLAGTSMVATTFAADTPLVVTGLIYAQGIQGNWLWWSLAFSGMLTVFFFAPLWRRSGVLTDMEFAELRYSGRPSAFLRGFRASYLVLVVNMLTMGWVNFAMATILRLTLGLGKLEAVFLCLGITLVYSTMSGMWAVLWTDMVQFVLKMSMVILLAYFAVHAVGGMHALVDKVHLADRALGRDSLALAPSWGSGYFFSFLVLMSVNWWSGSYPGAEPGGGGYITQRIFSAKDEKNSLAATLWFNVAHYALRPWPWILAALVALVVIPNTPDKEGAYITIMIRYLPPSLRGLMLAGFAAAYMSTVGTMMNLSASYMINDVYGRFIKKNASPRHYVVASRWATVLVTLASAIVTEYMTSIAGAWRFLMAIGAGAGLVFILRWYWWRISAWSEISALSGAAIFSTILQSRLAVPLTRVLHGIDPALAVGPMDSNQPHGFAWLMIVTTALTTVTWVTVTFLTRPEPKEKLQAFYDLVRPAALGWRPFAPESARRETTLRTNFFHWVLGFALIYGVLLGTGDLLLGHPMRGVEEIVGGAICAAVLFWNLERLGWTVFQ
jgi:Na+/proline symporter